MAYKYHKNTIKFLCFQKFKRLHNVNTYDFLKKDKGTSVTMVFFSPTKHFDKLMIYLICKTSTASCVVAADGSDLTINNS